MNEVVIEKMSSMKLFGMQQSFQTILQGGQFNNLTNDELINMLIQAEWEDRQTRKINRYIKSARFRYQACIEEIDYHANRNLDKTQFLRLADCSFIAQKKNILITGPTGVGKSFITSALGHQACVRGYKTAYLNTQKIFTKLRMSKADGTYSKELDKLERMDLVIIDDFGLQQLDNQNRMTLLEIIEDRYERKSTIISSQLPVNKWYDIIGEGTVADAILDRLINGSFRIELKGESLRKRK